MGVLYRYRLIAPEADMPLLWSFLILLTWRAQGEVSRPLQLSVSLRAPLMPVGACFAEQPREVFKWLESGCR